MPRIHERIAAECEALAVEENKLEQELIERVRETLPDLSPRDAAGALRNAAVSKAVNLDKVAVLRGKPTAIVEHRSPAEALRALQSVAPALIIEGRADEVDLAQLPNPDESQAEDDR